MIFLPVGMHSNQLYNSNRLVLQCVRILLGGESNCEELVRGLVTRNNGFMFIVGIAAYSIADCIS